MAALVTWGEELKTGWTFLDDDHHRFVELLNDLHRASRDGGGSEAAPAVLADLIALMTAHFDKEETAMRQSRYRLLSDHRMQHDLMRAKMDELALCIAAGSVVTAGALIDFMLDWLSQHIRRHDRDLARHIAKRVSVGR